MEKTKKLLVPIDFSPCSENALSYAIQLATQIKATLQVLNVTTTDIEETVNPYVAKAAVEEKTKSVEQSLQQSLSTVKKEVGESVAVFPAIETSVEIGTASLMISAMAKQDDIDIIIMGTQGENSVADRLLGSTASNVVNTAPCPVIVIPEGAMFQASMVIGYASNLINADPFEMWKAVELLKPIQPEAIHFVHVSEDQKEWDGKLEAFKAFFSTNIPQLQIDFHHLKREDKVQALNDFCAEHAIHLLVMYRPSRNFWQALLRKSFTQEMTKHIHVPLLVLKE